MNLWYGRTVVLCQSAALHANRVHRPSSERIWDPTEPRRNAIACEQAAGEASARQWPQSVCMDGCLMR
jgi:hypothetical protein